MTVRSSPWRRARWFAVSILLSAVASCGGADGGGGAVVSPPVVSVPAISAQPVAATVAVGGTASFTVAANGTALTYQWERSADGGLTWQPIAGATAASYALGAVTATQNGTRFRAIVQNSAGTVTSSAVILTVTGGVVLAVAPAITSQPQDQTSAPPNPATFTVGVTGSPTPTIQWQFSVDLGRTWTSIATANATAFTTSSFNLIFRFATATVNGLRFRALASNASGSVTSSEASWLVKSQSIGGVPLGIHVSTSGDVTATVSPTYGGNIALGSNPRAGIVQRISPVGTVSSLAGSSADGFVDAMGAAARFSQAWSIARDAAGNFYIADVQNRAVRRLAPDNTVSTLAGGPTGVVTPFSFVSAVAVGPDGAVYVSDGVQNRIKKLMNGTAVELGVIGSFSDMTFDASGTLYMLASGGVLKLSAGGVLTAVGGQAGLQFAEDVSPSTSLRGLAVDGTGNMFVTDANLCVVRKITPSGVVTTVAGGPLTGVDRCGFVDGTGRAARFGSELAGIAVDAAGNLYVADSDNLAIRKISPTGVVTTLVR